MRTALLRRLAGTKAEAVKPVPAKVRKAEPAVPSQVAAPQSPPPQAPAALQRPAVAARPDLAGFVKVVQQIAGLHAEGWPGNRKAMVSRVFSAIAAAYPAWGLKLVEFKAMLAECHRTGHLALVTADLKDKSQLDALRESAIAYKNTVWHLVRVED